MKYAIETSGLTKAYNRTTAVADLNLQVEPGQVFGLLGPNGAGKSTTIRMLLGLQRPTAGRAALLGLDAASGSVEIHRRSGYPELRALRGVKVTSSDGSRLSLDVIGEIGPVLRIIASHDPVELTSRPANLDELFLDFYRQPPEQEVSHAGSHHPA